MKPRALTDMAKTPKEIAEESRSMGSVQLGSISKYPYGLCISLDHDDLEKLDLDPDCDVGDMLHLFAMAKVTSKNERETEDGPTCRIELQITHLGIEDEDDEDAPDKPSRAQKRYGKDDEAESDDYDEEEDE